MNDSRPTEGPLTTEELQLAARNRGMPLEALRYDITPTGMHYLLVHFDIPEIDALAWRLEIGGNVDRPRSLTLAELRARPSRTTPVTMECAGNGRARLSPRPISQPWLVEAVGTAQWTGTSLRELLVEAGVRPAAVELVFRGADHGVQGEVEHDYARSLPLHEALRPEVLLAYEMNGRPLEPQHGAPLRLLVPGWYGMTSVKWLTRIEAVTEPFDGYQPAGAVTLRGRAWSGSGEVARVEVGVDGGWRDAELEPPIGEFAWRGWSFEWTATSGDHELSCRATDAVGHTQPLEQAWNYQGMGNNLVQTVAATVHQP